MNEEQINGLVNDLILAVNARGGTGGAGNAGGDAQTPKAPVTPEPDIKEMFDPASPKYDPETAVKRIAQSNYAPLLADIGRNAAEGLYSQFREEYPDFKEYEKDIRTTLEKSGVVTPNATQINTLYLATKGHRITLKERQTREAARTAAPTPKVDDKPAVAPLDDDEKRIARRMFPESQDPEKDYRDYAERLERGDTTMKVPLSGGIKR